MLLLGNDPGGEGKNGVAALHAHNGVYRACASTVRSVDEAVDWFRGQAGEAAPEMAGIDTFLSWSTGGHGWRVMDNWILNRYAAAKKSVFCSNSARGSMAVQGMALAIRLRQIWPRIRLNETHPKVQYHALSNNIYNYGKKACMDQWLLQQLSVPNGNQLPIINNEHEWDALFSAWACLCVQRGTWSNDLVLLPSTANVIFPAGPAEYFWPP